MALPMVPLTLESGLLMSNAEEMKTDCLTATMVPLHLCVIMAEMLEQPVNLVSSETILKTF